jgi:hypothetical protein
MGSSWYGVIDKAGLGGGGGGSVGRSRQLLKVMTIQADNKTFRKADLIIEGIIPLLVLAFALCYTPINIISG